MQPLVVFSHLRWDFVYQRPQQLMVRLAKHYDVFFVEEPVHDNGPAYLEITEPAANVCVCRPHTALPSRGFHDDQLPLLQGLIEELIVQRNLLDPIAWLYTPMALPLVQRLQPCAIVYDCMDELSAFLNAPKQLLQRESALLKAADVVFTGGPSLYRSKRRRHQEVYCFASSVNADHFAQARDPALEHADQLSLARPRLGFYGVIDERLDLSLLALVAHEHPEWQIVMVGPVVKIEPSTLPHAPNIHYFGQRSYSELPRFLAGWDVCLMPFAMNASTRFISPTKTLEYMAAEKPVVSTPVADVLEPYGDVVYSGTNDSAFVRACEGALRIPAEASTAQIARMREIVAGTSWDATAAEMRAIISTFSQPRRAVPAQAVPGSVSAPELRRAVVLGAGPTGLSAAYHIGEDALLVEQNDTVGGWCRSIHDHGFTFDYAGHIMFSNDPYVHELYQLLLGSNVHWQDREAWIYSNEVYTRYPFQGALYGLPADILKDCLVGAIEARFGPINERVGNTPALAQAVDSTNTSSSLCKAESITDCCADGVVPDSTASTASGRPQQATSHPRNFEEFIYSVWGSGVAKHFALPYNRKLWAVPLTQMETSWLGGRVPLPNLTEMIEGALRPVAKPMGPNARFGYPLKGGFQALMDGFLPHLRGELKLNTRVTRITPSEHHVAMADGSSYQYEHLISTMPLPVLVGLIGHEAPRRIRAAAEALRHVSVRCVNLGIGRPNVTDKHWIYYPGDSVFHRIFVQGNVSEHVNPPGGFGLTCEITYSPHKPLPCEGDDLIDRCVADCIRVGLLREDDVIVARNQVDMPYAYVVYDHARAANVEVIRRWLNLQDIHLAGRYSEWEYYNSDHAFLAGRKAAATVRAALSGRSSLVGEAGTARSGSLTVST